MKINMIIYMVLLNIFYNVIGSIIAFIHNKNILGANDIFINNKTGNFTNFVFVSPYPLENKPWTPSQSNSWVQVRNLPKT